MILHSISDTHAVFSLESSIIFDKNKALEYLKEIFKEKGLSIWAAVNFDIFEVKNETLCIAYPGPYTEYSLAGYALTYLKEYFTE